MKKKDTILYALLSITTLVAVYFGLKSSSLKQEISKTKRVKEDFEVLVNNNNALLKIDSILINGKYNEAIASYTSTLENSKEINLGIPLRIELAEKLRDTDLKNSMNSRLEKNNIDSRSNNETTPQELRKLDSLRFALEKARVQVSNMRNQLKNKSYGEYLSFSSKKGTALHYIGQVNNKKANGTGIALLETGSRYEGEWKDNERSGNGTFYWPDGEYYIGNYENDMRNGNGTYYWTNGDKYVGQWKDDKRSGRGNFYDKDGNLKTSGIWENDKLKESDKKLKKQKP